MKTDFLGGDLYSTFILGSLVEAPIIFSVYFLLEWASFTKQNICIFLHQFSRIGRKPVTKFILYLFHITKYKSKNLGLGRWICDCSIVHAIKFDHRQKCPVAYQFRPVYHWKGSYLFVALFHIKAKSNSSGYVCNYLYIYTRTISNRCA